MEVTAMSEFEPVDKRERIQVSQRGGVRRRERVIADAGAERRQTLNRVAQFIWLIFGIIIGLIAFRVVLLLLSANATSGFANFIYSLTDIFLAPFAGLLADIANEAGTIVFEPSSLIAMLVYAVLALIIVQLIRVVFDKSRARRVSSIETD